MTDSITVATFVLGLVLLIASLIGKELKIAAVEMPALNRGQRLVVGVVGITLAVPHPKPDVTLMTIGEIGRYKEIMPKRLSGLLAII